MSLSIWIDNIGLTPHPDVLHTTQEALTHTQEQAGIHMYIDTCVLPRTHTCMHAYVDTHSHTHKL